jgi:hypothetical protein
MLPGTIIMLLIIVVGIFGTAGYLLSQNLKNDKKDN